MCFWRICAVLEFPGAFRDLNTNKLRRTIIIIQYIKSERDIGCALLRTRDKLEYLYIYGRFESVAIVFNAVYGMNSIISHVIFTYNINTLVSLEIFARNLPKQNSRYAFLKSQIYINVFIFFIEGFPISAYDIIIKSL